MGGFGSGRCKFATTLTVGECPTLDVDVFTEAVTTPGGRAPIRWRDENGHGDEVASIMVHIERDGEPRFTPTHDDIGREDVADPLADRATHLRLEYTTSPDADDSREHEHRITLEYTPCTFGGVRPWFLCPGRRCSDRVGKLHLPPGRETFACRECYELGYYTSRQSGVEWKQAELRYRRAFAKADAKDRRPHPESMSPLVPERPKGMHQDTFEELLEDVDRARGEWSGTLRSEIESRAGDAERWV